MKNSIYLVLFISVFFNSCFKSIKTNEKSFANKQNLSAQIVYLSTLTNPLDLNYNGRFLAMANYQLDTCFYFLFSNNFSESYSYGLKGEGPNDFISPSMARTNTNYFYLQGYNNPNSLKQVELSYEGGVRIIKDYNMDLGVKIPNHLHVINDSLLVYNDFVTDRLALVIYNLKSQKLMNELEFFKTDIENSFFQENRGIMAANSKCIAYGYALQNKIDFYDYNFNKIKSMGLDGDANKETKDFMKVKNYYINLVAGEKYIYALYASGVTSEQINDKTSYFLEVYDIQGNPVILYSLDKKITLMAVDEEQQIIYGYDSGTPDILLKYQL